MFMFQKLPFYVKYGAIPESYTIALSYEEQLLWLCKHIEDLDSKIDESFLNLQNYINEGLENLQNTKQDKLTAGDNIIIQDNIISAIWGVDITSDIIEGYAIDQSAEVGDTLDLTPTQIENCAYIILDEFPLGSVFKIKGVYSFYVIDSNNKVLEAIYSGTGHSTGNQWSVIKTTQTGRIAIGFYNTDTIPYGLIKTASLDGIIEAIADLEENKQDKLTAGSGISIVDNVISATGGGGGVSITNLETDLNLVDGTTLQGASGFYNTSEYSVKITDSGSHTTTIFDNNQIYYFEAESMCLIGGTKTLYYDYDTSTWEVLTDREITKLNGEIDLLKVHYLESNLTLADGTEPDMLTGFYYTDSYSIQMSSGGHTNTIYNNNDIVYYDNTAKTFSNSLWKMIYSGGTWSRQPNASISDSSLADNHYTIPTSHEVYNAISNISTGITNETTGTTSIVTKIWVGTQAEYNLLPSLDSTTLYFIKES